MSKGHNISFLQTCLHHYNNNIERLVNALYDNTVPENLQFEEPSTSVASSNVDDENERPFISKDFSLLEQRANIYDNDEFDIFNQDSIDLTRIHRGKKFVMTSIVYFSYINSSRTRDTLAHLDDKSHLMGMGDRYSRLGLVEDETDGEYDDEYDDTYDDGIVNVRDKDDAIDNELQKNENRFDIH